MTVYWPEFELVASARSDETEVAQQKSKGHR